MVVSETGGRRGVKDPRRRFSERAENYAAYRPGYPRAVLQLLEGECGLTKGSVVADVASGTGLLSELFLENGNRVYGVEPNDEMRLAGERYLGEHGQFASVAATAEATTLADGSVDFVVVGHAFHWFDAGSARAEFARILRPGGWVVLLWNETRSQATPFMESYERVIRAHKTEEYEPFDLEEEVRSFFGAGGFEARSFRHRQGFDLDGLKGRVLSSSYVPDVGQPGHAEMVEEIEELFRSHQRGGRVEVEYETMAYFGRLRR